MVQPWGRQTPTAHIGLKESHKFSVSLTRRRTDGRYDAIKALFTRQRMAGAILCYRDIVGDIFFCQITSLQKQNIPGGETVSAGLEEAYYLENVTP